MRNKLFDEHVKKQFDGYRPEVAPHIWEKIAAEQGKRKPAPFWLSLFANKWMAAALILVAAAGAGVYLTQRHSGKAATEASAVAAETGTPASNDNTASPSNNADNSTAAITPSANGNRTAGSNAPAVNDQVSGNNADAILSNNTSNQSNTASSGAKQSGLTERNKNRRAASASRVVIESADADADAQVAQSTGRNTATAINSINYTLSRTSRPFDLLAARKSNTPASLKFKKVPAAGTIPCPPAERDAAGNKSYFEVYGGPDYTFRSFSDTANSSYLKERKATVSAGFSYSAGVRFTKVFRNGVSIRTGLNYSQVNERFKYVKGNVTHNIYITNTAGDTTGTYVERGTQYQQSTNVYRSLDIPLVAGYELGNGRIHANVNAGVMINILSRQKGYVLAPSGLPVDISTGKSNSVYSYKTNAGVSFLGSFSVYYKLNDRFHLLAEPYLRYGLSAVTKTDISLKQKNHTAGLRFGLRMDL